MNTRKSRQYRRVAQACETCRRKKIRCPGEKPRCSACTRLQQQCFYADGDHISEQTVTELESRVTDRLSQLEDKLDRIINKVEPKSTQGATPCSAPGSGHSISLSSPTTAHPFPVPSMSLPRAIIARTMDIYFERIHRQPLWLFDADSSPIIESSEELVCILLALGLTYSAVDFEDADLRSPEFYSDTARRLIMLKIADGSLSFQTLQALCLLAFFNTVSGDLALAGLNTALVKNVAQYTALGCGLPNNSQSSQEQSRLFWSISFLDTFYGPPTLVPLLHDIQAPVFSTVQTRHASTPCPPLPGKSSGASEETLPGIWQHSVRICSLWGDVRVYMSRCFENSTEHPWQSTSDYTTLCSRLMELESAHPKILSYNMAKFPDRSPQEVQEHRSEWLPWLRVQVTYHAIHCILNHPFLYSIKASKQTLGANTFWRATSEKALRHCTWISRLIRMASEKGLKLADPFFAQAAAIAGTLHLYWTRTSDQGLRASAATNLQICKTLITELALHWHVCVSIEQALNQFIGLVDPSQQEEESESTTLVDKTSLMWMLLDVTAPQFPAYSDDRASRNSAVRDGDQGHEYMTVDSSEIHTPRRDARESAGPADMRESTAHYASPPEWLPSRSGGATSPVGARLDVHSSQQGDFHNSFNGLVSDYRDDTANLDLSWGPWEHMLRMGDNSVGSLDWLDFSNL